MKVWITKYSLTKGIIECEVEDETPHKCVRVNNEKLYGWYLEAEYKKDKKDAMEIAEEMRLAKIESLKKQLLKLENMEIKVVGMEE